MGQRVRRHGCCIKGTRLPLPGYILATCQQKGLDRLSSNCSVDSKTRGEGSGSRLDLHFLWELDQGTEHQEAKGDELATGFYAEVQLILCQSKGLQHLLVILMILLSRH